MWWHVDFEENSSFGEALRRRRAEVLDQRTADAEREEEERVRERALDKSPDVVLLAQRLRETLDKAPEDVAHRALRIVWQESLHARAGIDFGDEDNPE